MAPGGCIAVQGEESVPGLVLLVRGNQILAQGTKGDANLWAQMGAKINVVASVVLLVGIIRQFVVFKAVDPTVVVHIDPKEKLGTIHVVAQKRLIVVGNGVGQRAVVVLIEVRYKVAVFIPTWIDLLVARSPVLADRIGELVLIVVVLHQFQYMGAFVLVIDEAGTEGGEGSRVVARIHAVGFGKDEPRVIGARQVDHPSRSRSIPFDARPSGVILLSGIDGNIGVLSIGIAQVVFAVEIEAQNLI